MGHTKRNHNIWFYILTQKRCPTCKKETKGQVMSWYEYTRNKKYLVAKFCEGCVEGSVARHLKTWIGRNCQSTCTYTFIVGNGSLPDCLEALYKEIQTGTFSDWSALTTATPLADLMALYKEVNG